MPITVYTRLKAHLTSFVEKTPPIPTEKKSINFFLNSSIYPSRQIGLQCNTPLDLRLCTLFSTCCSSHYGFTFLAMPRTRSSGTEKARIPPHVPKRTALFCPALTHITVIFVSGQNPIRRIHRGSVSIAAECGGPIFPASMNSGFL